MELSPSRYRWLVSGLFLLALAVRLGVTARFQGLDSLPDKGAYPDQIEYDDIAWRLSRGEGYTGPDGEPTAFRTPGTPLTLLPVYLVFGRNYVALRVWMSLLSAATVVALAWFTRLAFGQAAALCAAAILAIDPGHFYYAQHLVSEVPYGLLATLATGTLLCAFTAGAEGRATKGWDIATGILSGLATLARPQFLFVMALIVAGALLARTRGRLCKQVALQVGAFLVCLAPWLVRNALVMGAPTMSTMSGYLFWGVHNEVVVRGDFQGTWTRPDELMTPDWPTDEVEYDRRCWQMGLEFVRSRPELLPPLLYHKYRRMLSAIAGTGDNALLRDVWALAWRLTVPFLLVGLVAAWKRNRRAFWIVGAHLGGLILLTLMFSGQIRYRHTVNPQFASLMGVGLVALLELAWRVVRSRPGTRPQAP